jgi:hypothetical protein
MSSLSRTRFKLIRRVLLFIVNEIRARCQQTQLLKGVGDQLFYCSRRGRVTVQRPKQPVEHVLRPISTFYYPLSIINITQLLEILVSEEMSNVLRGRRLSKSTVRQILENFALLQRRLVGRIDIDTPSVCTLFVITTDQAERSASNE